jgi:hypothetical protein
MHNMPPLYVNGNMPHNGGNARQNVFNPHAMHLKGVPSPGVQNPFPQQVPGFGAPRHNMSMNSPAAAPGFNMPFGQQVGMNPVNSFTPAVPAGGQTMASQALSPETRSATEQGAPSPFESNLVGGMRTLGIGHPGKLGGKSADDVFSPATSIGQTLPLRSQSSDQTTPQLTATTPDFRSNFARPDPIGPIEPIGRPRIVNGFETIDEATTVESSGRKSGAALGAPGPALGSAALSAGAEEVKDIPAPRRVSNTAALGGTWAPPSLSASTSWGPSPFAMAPGAGIWGGSTTTSQVDTPHWPTGSSANSSPFGKSKMTALPNSAQSTLTRGFNPVTSAVEPPPTSSSSASSAFFSSPMQAHHNTQQLPLNNNPFGPPGQTSQQPQQHHAQNQAQQPQQRLI